LSVGMPAIQLAKTLMKLRNKVKGRNKKQLTDLIHTCCCAVPVCAQPYSVLGVKALPAFH